MREAPDNHHRSGIGAVTARLPPAVCLLPLLPQGRCPQLQNEAEFYRYSDAAGDRQAEAPVDDHNHALAALRFLVSRLECLRGTGAGSEAAA